MRSLSKRNGNDDAISHLYTVLISNVNCSSKYDPKPFLCFICYTEQGKSRFKNGSRDEQDSSPIGSENNFSDSVDTISTVILLVHKNSSLLKAYFCLTLYY